MRVRCAHPDANGALGHDVTSPRRALYEARAGACMGAVPAIRGGRANGLLLLVRLRW